MTYRFSLMVLTAAICLGMPLSASAAPITYTFDVVGIDAGDADATDMTGSVSVTIDDSLVVPNTERNYLSADLSDFSMSFLNIPVGSDPLPDSTSFGLGDITGARFVWGADDELLMFNPQYLYAFGNTRNEDDWRLICYGELPGASICLLSSPSQDNPGTVVAELHMTPEPATMAILAFGFVGATLRCRRRNR